jgi:hypothetical protein
LIIAEQYKKKCLSLIINKLIQKERSKSMGRKVSKVFMGLVIMGGIALSILNFVSPLPATQAIWGTTTTPNGPENGTT